ncbi:hypothetical protein SAMN06295912_101215 [Sphingomonas laterariae]|uniref:Uncharacterized protein n=1 Tax=Edaphosphingomonas laterariae TaxID=861865 RepID=A0A239BKZ5_9SPHN|nr:hypothetical protein [Sphingomonas laterariae]SNS08061.1 hypothetical protein SAMN06295912_101215 [Sphingomonas laterariae]
MNAPTQSLSPLEWQAVSIGLREVENCGCGGLNPPSRLSRLWTLITGSEPIRPLADPRLEALRQFVCHLHWDDREAEKLGQELIGLGYSPAQVSAIAALDRP